MAGWFVYVLECADGTLYTGITNDVGRRLRAHERGTASRYTRSRRPVQLLYCEERSSRSEALQREARIKRMDRRTKLELAAGPDGYWMMTKRPITREKRASSDSTE